MRVVADENIPYVREAFAEFGEVVTLPGRTVSARDLGGADLLLVRSITRVDAALLDGTAVKFVATATIGTDHVDLPYLQGRGIGFSSAPGCNANSVADYVSAALLLLAEKHGLDLSDMSLGVVGVGNVGRRVAARGRALGMNLVLNDPPLAETTCEPVYRPISEVQACDVITFHVPMEKSGPYPTHHLCNAEFLAALKPGVIIFNTSRGAVIDNIALLDALNSGHVRAAVLDVWEGEPNVNADLLAKVDLASPHIAGYSFDGKVNGTQQIYDATCRHFGRAASWNPQALLPTPECPLIALSPPYSDAVAKCVRAVYDIRDDDARMRRTLELPTEDHGAYFDRLRKEYPRRREFKNTRVTLTAPDDAVARQLTGLGFQVEVT
nr:erythronate-4-phosphate dehydrogenase [uncultured bacterium]